MKKYKIYFIIILFFVSFIFYIFSYKESFSIEKNKTNTNISKYTAVIVEPREHKALSFVLQNFLENLNDDWNIIIYHGNQNETFIDNIIQNELNNYKHRIIKNNLNIDNLTIDDYNQLLTTPEFYHSIPTETFLIFQTDSIICEENKDLINEFLEYDYVGAPWAWHNAVGNGGLSLRKKSKMLEILTTCSYDIYANQPNVEKAEDMYFAMSCENVKKNIPSVEIAKKFAIESIGTDNFFGVHKAWLHNNENVLANNCKAIKKLKELQ